MATQGRPFRLPGLEFDEKWMNDVILRAGGVRLESEVDFPNGVRNCDYRIGELFIELKTLERDLFDAPERQRKILEFLRSQPSASRNGVTEVDVRNLSSEAKRTYWEIFLSGIERKVRDASVQIKETVRFLGTSSFRGAVFLLNRECETVDPSTLQQYADRLIHKERYSALHYALSFTAIAGVAEGSQRPVLQFSHTPHANGADLAILELIQKSFRTKLEEALGKKIESAPGWLGWVSNVRADRSFERGPARVTLISKSIDKVPPEGAK